MLIFSSSLDLVSKRKGCQFGARGLPLETIKSLGLYGADEPGLRRTAPGWKTRAGPGQSVSPFLMWPVRLRKPPKTGRSQWVFRTEMLRFSVFWRQAYRAQEKLQQMWKLHLEAWSHLGTINGIIMADGTDIKMLTNEHYYNIIIQNSGSILSKNLRLWEAWACQVIIL